MGVHFIVNFGIFPFLLFAGLGIMFVGVGIPKWGEAQKFQYTNEK